MPREDNQAEEPVDFYGSYSAYKSYTSSSLAKKDIRRFDAEIWHPGSFTSDMKCLEIGSGTGTFLAYLDSKGVTDFVGIDHDPALKTMQPAEVKERFECVDAWQYLKACPEASFQRIVLLDVLEHFDREEGFRLITLLKKVLRDDGKIIVRVPNAASPWGLSFQFGDLTHQALCTPESLRQMGMACGLGVDAVFDQRRGSRRRRVTDKIFHKCLAWVLLTPPQFWGANLYCIFSRLDS